MDGTGASASRNENRRQETITQESMVFQELCTQESIADAIEPGNHSIGSCRPRSILANARV